MEKTHHHQTLNVEKMKVTNLPSSSPLAEKKTNNNNKLEIVLLTLTTGFLFADQNVMAPNLTAIADDFGFDEIERDKKLGGEISLAFFVIGGTASMAIALLIDKADRRWLFTGTVILGEVSCALTGLSRNFSEFFWLRALTGISIGGALPIFMSMFADYFPTGQRARSTVFAGIAMSVGTGLGQTVASFVEWRISFVLVSVPAILTTLIFALTAKDIKRGGKESYSDKTSDGSEFEHKSYKDLFFAAKDLFRSPAILLIFMQGLPGSIPWGIISVFLQDYLKEERSLNSEESVAVLLIFGLGLLGGSMFGGLVGDYLFARQKERMLTVVMSVATLVGMGCFLLMINVSFSTTGGFILMAIATGATSSFTGANIKPLIMEITTPDVRGTAFAWFSLADDMGKGLGPFIISLLIESLGGRAAGFNLAITVGWSLCAINVFLLNFVIVDAVKDARRRGEEISRRKQLR